MENDLQKIAPKSQNKVEDMTQKLQEYEKMFKILYKQKDYAKIKSLAAELKELDPTSVSAEKWAQKAEAKLSGKSFLFSLFSRFSRKKMDKMDQAQATPVASAPAPIIPAKAENLEKKYTGQSPEVSLAAPRKPSDLTPTPPKTPLVAVQTPALPSFETKIATPITKSVAGSRLPAKTPSENLFRRIFRAKLGLSSKKSLVSENAVVKSEEKSQTPLTKPLRLEVKQPFDLFKFAKLFMGFTAVFIFVTGTFLYVDFIDKENRFLSLVGVSDNTGSRLHAAAEELEKAKQKVEILKEEADKYQKGYEDPVMARVQEIMDQRIDWTDLFSKIKEITHSVYELNDFFKYVEYDSYAVDAEKKTIQITGRLRDPQGQNLTKLVELEEAFMYYPKDKNNLDDKTKPYFQGFQELTSLSKTLDPETGQYVSTFQLTFSLAQ